MTVIGTSDLTIFPLALGGNTFGWTSDQATSESVLDAFTARGGNFIDTADGYSAWAPGHKGGESETIIGEWTTSRGNRDDVVIATKVSTHPDYRGLSARNIAQAADASLERLRTDHIDLYYAHFDDAETPLIETIAALDSLVQQGKVRYIGISNYTAERINEWMSIVERNGFAAPVALQPHYNLVERRNFEQTLAPVAEDHKLSVFPYFSLASGFLTGKYRTAADLEGAARSGAAGNYLNDAGLRVIDVLSSVAEARGASLTTTALAWLRSKPTVAAPLASVSRVEQLADLFAAVELDLTAEETAALDSASESFA
ncbi:aldo/keto reductase [Paenarthrobacter sp. DKR-5]|uniref:aldo/keto reductase n=1 Tax=Paenarthrobacter sp. DKR-5 TaxID=2835535 RepID=UPI001BDD2947|nr:aldo/keto reductase [Paenarthrobacter sp. DKR-5]MBT1004101.1 aldo/keto reductase [Paenarthrobacter sp. DKR-5]